MYLLIFFRIDQEGRADRVKNCPRLAEYFRKPVSFPVLYEQVNPPGIRMSPICFVPDLLIKYPLYRSTFPESLISSKNRSEMVLRSSIPG